MKILNTNRHSEEKKFVFILCPECFHEMAVEEDPRIEVEFICDNCGQAVTVYFLKAQ